MEKCYLCGLPGGHADRFGQVTCEKCKATIESPEAGGKRWEMPKEFTASFSELCKALNGTNPKKQNSTDDKTVLLI